MPDKTVQRIAPLGIFFLASLGAYFLALSAEFFGDDLGHIVYNQKSLSQGFKSLMAGPLADRPLLMLFVWLNYLLGGVNPFVYRLSSIVLHSLVCWMGFNIVVKLIPDISKMKKWLIVFCLLVFAVHPVNSQAVTTIIQSGVLISILLMLCSFWYFLKYVESRRVKDLSFVLVLFMLALLAKPNVIVFPLIIGLYLRWFTEGTWKQSIKPVFFLLVVACLPAAYYFLFKFNVQSDAQPWWLYFSVQGKAILSYMKILVWPFGLHFLYDLRPLGFSWVNVVSLIVHFLFIAWLLGPGKRINKLGSFFILCMYILFIPESSFFSIRHLAFEHRSYVPFLFFFMGLSCFIVGMKGSAKIKMALTLLFVPLLTVANFQRINEISTFEKWVMNTIHHDSSDKNFNIFQLDHFIQANPEFGLTLSKFLVEDDPQNEVYKNFHQIYKYLNGELNKDQIDKNLFEFLSEKGLSYHWLARYSFNRFYLTQILKESDSEREALKFDNLMFPQIPELLRNFEKYQPFFKSYARRLVLLSQGDLSIEEGNFRMLRAKLVLFKLYGQGVKEELEAKRQMLSKDLSPEQIRELDDLMSLKVELK